MTFIQHLVFAADFIAIVVTCLVVSAACEIRGSTPRWVAFLVLFYSLLVLPTWMLSTLNWLNQPVAHLASHAAIGLLIYCAWWVVRRTQPTFADIFNCDNHPRIPWSELRTHPSLLGLLVVICVAYAVNGIIVLTVAQHNNDAMAYHLPRILHWLRAGNFEHFRTYWHYQTTQPMNSSLAMLWTVLHTGGERLVGFVQYFSVLGSALVVYGMARLLGNEKLGSLFAACMWLAFPIVALQSTTAQNDMVAMFLVSSSVYLYICGMRSASYGPLVVSGLAVGCALGTKVTVFLFAFSYVLLMTWALFVYGRAGFQRTVFWGIICVLGIVGLAASTYVQNLRVTGHLLGPQATDEAGYLPGASFAGTKATLTRYAFESLDTTGLPRWFELWLQDRLAVVGRCAFMALAVDENGPASSISPSCAFGFYQQPKDAPPHWGPVRDRRREESAWMGPVGAFVLLPTFLCGLFWWNGRRFGHLRTLFCWLAALYVITVSALLPWSPWRGRYMAMGAVFVVPLMAAYGGQSRRMRFVQMCLCGLAAFVLCNSLLFSRSTPLIGAHSVFLSDYASQRSARQTVLETSIRILEEQVPAEASIGAVAVPYEYPLFGRKLTRNVVPVYLHVQDTPGFFRASDLTDYIVVGHENIKRRPITAVDEYSLVASGSWGALFCHDRGVTKHRERVAAQLFTRSLLSSAPPVLRSDTFFEQNVRFRSTPMLGTWGFERVKHARFWWGPGEDHRVVFDLHSKCSFRARISLDVAPGPSRRGPLRHLECAVQGDGLEIKEQVRFSGETEVSFHVPIPEGDFRIILTALDPQDVERLPNGDTRPLVVECRGIEFAKAE